MHPLTSNCATPPPTQAQQNQTAVICHDIGRISESGASGQLASAIFCRARRTTHTHARGPLPTARPGDMNGALSINSFRRSRPHRSSKLCNNSPRCQTPRGWPPPRPRSRRRSRGRRCSWSRRRSRRIRCGAVVTMIFSPDYGAIPILTHRALSLPVSPHRKPPPPLSPVRAAGGRGLSRR